MWPLPLHEMVLNQCSEGRHVGALIPKHWPSHDSFDLVKHKGPWDEPHQRLLQNGLVQSHPALRGKIRTWTQASGLPHTPPGWPHFSYHTSGSLDITHLHPDQSEHPAGYMRERGGERRGRQSNPYLLALEKLATRTQNLQI